MVKHSSSRVAVGTALPREYMMQLALMSSENRAASALSRNYRCGQEPFVATRNRKATTLGMTSTQMSNPTGLSPLNKASANDLVRMVQAAETCQPITTFTTSTGRTLNFGRLADQGLPEYQFFGWEA